MFLVDLNMIRSVYVCCLQVEQAQAGLKALGSSEKAVNHLRSNFVNIERYI